MASILVCDVCGKEIHASSHAAMKVTAGPLESGASVNRTFHMHGKCYSGMRDWMRKAAEKAAQFKEVK